MLSVKLLFMLELVEVGKGVSTHAKAHMTSAPSVLSCVVQDQPAWWQRQRFSLGHRLSAITVAVLFLSPS